MTATKMAPLDRIYALELIDGEKAKDSTGMVDTRLFKGGNRLHIKRDPESNFWTFSYDLGILPQDLQCKFTNARLATAHAEQYFKSRNLQLKEVDA